MRYTNLPKTPFTSASGRTVSIYDMREFPTGYTKAMSITLQSNDSLDEICSRPEVYGANSEINVYQLFDFNHVKIVEGNFTNIKTLDIPNLL